jgi:hypothetical protein
VRLRGNRKADAASHQMKLVGLKIICNHKFRYQCERLPLLA